MLKLVLFLPVVSAMIFALVKEFGRKYLVGTITLSILSVMVLARFVILAVIFEETAQTDAFLLWLESALSMYIIPVMYMYLCDQCGTKWNNREAIVMSLIPIAALIYQPLRPAIVVINCAIVTGCMVRLYFRLKKYGLHFTRPMWLYYTWMFFVLASTALSFIFDIYSNPDLGLQIGFFVFYAVLVTLGYVFIPYSFRVCPIETEDGQGVALDSFIIQNDRLIREMHQLMDQDRIYLRQGLLIDDLASMMGTNRTYVTRLMRQEYDRTFNEHLNNCRIEYSKNLLLTTNQSVEDIALNSGFPGASAYCRVFKRVTGTSPVAWKESQSR